MGIVARGRERLVLGHVRRQLHTGERILAWSHASVPDTRAPGLFVVTDQRFLLHVASSSYEDVVRPLDRFRLFDLDRSSEDTARVRLRGDDAEVVAEFSLTSRARARAMGRVLGELSRARIESPASFNPSLTSPIPPVARSMRHHARRVWVTVVGVLVLVLSVVFASPFVPGPGALTAVAGFAILAKEYEWARDVHVWAARQADRFVTWLRRRWRRSSAASVTPITEARAVSELPLPEREAAGGG
jgi:uncharacterized protein (TIGR02611 family)